MKLILISPKNRTAYNFRGDLIKRIINAGYEVVVIGPNRIDIEKIEALGARFVEIPMNKNGLNPISDLKYLSNLVKLFKSERPDVTLGYTSKPVIYGSIAAKIAKVPHRVAMVTGAGYAFTSLTKKARLVKSAMSFLYKIAFNSANTVIFQNSDDKNQFIEEKLLKEGKCAVVNGSGVNTEAFPVCEYPETTTFFMLSRIMYSKGIREYLEACKIVKEKYPEVRCMLLGALEGIQDSISKEDIEEYVKNSIIEYFGETDRVADYYKQCSVYVLPSYREGTPRTVLEAMSMARPIITTSAPGCRETVIDGKNGFLVPVKDADAVADKMIEFIKTPEKIAEMGKNSREYCLKKFDVNKVNNEMCKYLKIKE